VGLLAATRHDRFRAVVAVDVKSDWTERDVELAERSRDASQRVEPDRDRLVDRLGRSLLPVVFDADELERVAARSVEPAGEGWRFRWDRRVLATEPVDPFSFLPRVRCAVHVIAGRDSVVMPPASAERFAGAIPDARLELIDGVGHHVELEAPQRVAATIRSLV
jgi:pimeloyl-ACP methyl ester carboxylesterase